MRAESLAAIVNPFGSGSSDEYLPRSQGFAPVKPVEEKDVARMFWLYSSIDIDADYQSCLDYVLELDLAVLSPSQIDRLLQMVIHGGFGEKTNHGNTGIFFSCLINRSYYKGYNDFTLNLLDTRIFHLCSSLMGEEGRDINVKLIGNTGSWCSDSSSHCNIAITGHVHEVFGYHSDRCSYEIRGDAAHDCGIYMSNCRIKIQGNIGKSCGVESVDCIFQTSRSSTYETLCTYVSRGFRNRIILTDMCGNTIKGIER